MKHPKSLFVNFDIQSKVFTSWRVNICHAIGKEVNLSCADTDQNTDGALN